MRERESGIGAVWQRLWHFDTRLWKMLSSLNRQLKVSQRERKIKKCDIKT